MAPKRKLPPSKQPVEMGHSDSDDDAPEEVTGVQAREEAIQARMQEKQTVAEKRRAEAEKRRTRTQAAQAAAAASGKRARTAAGGDDDDDADEDEDDEDEEALALLEGDMGTGSGSEDEEEGEESEEEDEEEAGALGYGGAEAGGEGDEDLLPESVLAAVAEREARQAAAELERAAAVAAGRRAAKRAAKKARLAEVKQGVVAVAVLPKLKAGAGPGQAGNFMREALYGSGRIRRSVDALTRNRRGPSSKFVR